MCGIAGSWRSDWDVAAALDAIAHRGPDARGVAESPDSVLGHVRLSIMDPEPRSDQPFFYRGITLTYNGELWNAQALRRELAEGFSHEFETTGDTEVVAAALAEWGTEALTRLDGQFALAWRTAGSGDVYLARDRWGEVPLYMLEEGDRDSLLGAGVCWASERKAFGQRGAEAVPVPAGSYVRLWTGAVRSFYGFRGQDWISTGMDGASYVLDALRRGTTERLQSDVPVCALLSGGLDSTLILSLIKLVHPNVVAYVASYDEESLDLQAARYAAGWLGVPLREVEVRPPDDAAIRQAIETIEIPMKAQVEIATLCIPLAERIAADGFKVVLSGEGADELFGGYGSLMRKAQTDESWEAARRYSFEKMARGNFVRTNKAFMAHGVEARLPFMDRQLVEYVLSAPLAVCPPAKALLKRAAAGLVPSELVDQQKRTFQGASGVSGYLDDRLDGSQVKVYNQVARDLFGGIPRG